jgi:hypothetical protein
MLGIKNSLSLMSLTIASFRFLLQVEINIVILSYTNLRYILICSVVEPYRDSAMARMLHPLRPFCLSYSHFTGCMAYNDLCRRKSNFGIFSTKRSHSNYNAPKVLVKVDALVNPIHYTHTLTFYYHS